MPDIGWMELLVIGIVALIVVGPKDLPRMFRAFGQFTGRVRGMAKEFSRAMNEAADDAGIGDVAKDLRGYTNPKKMGLDAVNRAVGDAFEGIDPKLYPEGSETRKLAEARAAEAEALRAARDEKIRQRKLAAAAGEAPADDTPPPAAAQEPSASHAAPASDAPETPDTTKRETG